MRDYIRCFISLGKQEDPMNPGTYIPNVTIAALDEGDLVDKQSFYSMTIWETYEMWIRLNKFYFVNTFLQGLFAGMDIAASQSWFRGQLAGIGQIPWYGSSPRSLGVNSKTEKK